MTMETVTGFAKRHGVSLATIRNWRMRGLVVPEAGAVDGYDPTACSRRGPRLTAAAGSAVLTARTATATPSTARWLLRCCARKRRSPDCANWKGSRIRARRVGRDVVRIVSGAMALLRANLLSARRIDQRTRRIVRDAGGVERDDRREGPRDDGRGLRLRWTARFRRTVEAGRPVDFGKNMRARQRIDRGPGKRRKRGSEAKNLMISDTRALPVERGVAWKYLYHHRAARPDVTAWRGRTPTRFWLALIDEICRRRLVLIAEIFARALPEARRPRARAWPH